MSNGAPQPFQPPPRDRRNPGDDPGHTPRAGRNGPGATARRRSPARTLAPLAVAAWAVLEIWLLTVVADTVGGLTVLLLLVAGLVLGSLVVRHAGRRAWRQLSSAFATAAGPGPAREETARRGGNTFTMLGGLLLMLPGLVSDAAALLCLFPPTAALLRRGAERRLSRLGGTDLHDAVRQARDAQQQARIHRPDGRIVQGEVVRDDEGPPAT